MEDRTVLIVDDDPVILRLLRGHLRRRLETWTFLIASDGFEALEIVEREHVDLVATDILMQGKEGLQTIKELRRGHPDVRIIAFSGGGRRYGFDFLQVARTLGAERTLEKPFPGDELVEAITGLLAQERETG